MSIPVPEELKCTKYSFEDGYPIYKIGGEFFESFSDMALTKVDSELARLEIGKVYLTKRFEYDGDVTSIKISDGRSYIHPRFALSRPEENLVYAINEGNFISLTELDSIIEDIPLEGVL